MKFKTIVSLAIVICFLASCEGQSQNNQTKASPDFSGKFSNYWFQGKAELTSYELSQARYGEIREGEAIMIFVTEDFSRSKQVKLDDPFKNAKDAVKVMKLNTTRKFNTGIYPYSMMESVFTPIDYINYPNSLKVTTSSQEWCGHTFSQINLRDNKYHFSGKSYFESEGDEEVKLDNALLESEIFNLIRLNPDGLPVGEIDIVPSGFFSRLSHIDLKNQKATSSLEESDDFRMLTIDYKDIKRTVKIEFSRKFPFEINSWEETYKSGFGKNARVMTTSARKKKTILLDYWSKNHLSDSTYRKALMMD